MKTVMKYSLLAAVAAPLLAGAARANYTAYTDENLPVRSLVLNQDTPATDVTPAVGGSVQNQEQENEPGGSYIKRQHTAFEAILNYPFREAQNNKPGTEEFSYLVSGENGNSKCILTLHVFSHEKSMKVSSLNDPGGNFVLPVEIELRQFVGDGIRFPANGLDNSAPWILNDQPVSFIDGGHAVLDACAPPEAAQFTHRHEYFRVYREYFAQNYEYFALESGNSTINGATFVFDGPLFQWELTNFVRELVRFTRNGGYFAQASEYITREGMIVGTLGKPYLPFFGSVGGPYFGTGLGPYYEPLGGPYFPFSGNFGGASFGGVGGMHANFRPPPRP